jgi:hypothetical protein
MPSRRIAPLLAFLYLLNGCQPASSTRYDSDFFQRPPEIWEKDGAYHLRLVEPERDPTGFSIAHTEIQGNDVHVWVSVRHSSGSNPNRLIPLGVPVAAGASPTFWWRDPDGTLHPLKVRRS